jgi:hypothetical protein
MVRERADYPVIEWRDFLWKRELLVVRDEVAKQTTYVLTAPGQLRSLLPFAFCLFTSYFLLLTSYHPPQGSRPGSS